MALTIKCEQVEERLIKVNGKEVRQDMDGNWRTRAKMLNAESHFFNEFLKTTETTGKKYLKVTYEL